MCNLVIAGTDTCRAGHPSTQSSRLSHRQATVTCHIRITRRHRLHSTRRLLGQTVSGQNVQSSGSHWSRSRRSPLRMTVAIGGATGSGGHNPQNFGELARSKLVHVFVLQLLNKKLSYCWETVRRDSMPRIAEMDVEMTT